jgi:hypothetical protein
LTRARVHINYEPHSCIPTPIYANFPTPIPIHRPKKKRNWGSEIATATADVSLGKKVIQTFKFIYDGHLCLVFFRVEH